MRVRVHPIKSIRHRISRRAYLAEEWYLGIRDRRRVRQAFPQLARYSDTVRQSRSDLEAHYREYVTTVSADGVAISLELAAFLDVICNARVPNRLLDLGSGFSSFVLRRYAARSGSSAEVDSVDHAGEWLAATRRYLEAQHLDVSGLHLWDEFRSRKHRPFDFVLLDLGSSDRDSSRYRLAILPEVLDLLAPGGILILDDAHRTPFAYTARRLLDLHACRYWSLKRFVQDRFGRFALLATR